MRKTSENREQILELYSQGVKPTDIVARLGYTHHQSVYNLLKKEGVFVKKETVYHTKYTVDKTYFENIDTEEKAYVLGFICADGHIRFNRLTVDASAKDIDILEKIRAALGSNAPITSMERSNPYPNGKPTCDMRRLDIASVNLMRPLLDAGLTSDKTYTLTSDILRIVPEHLIRHFLRGYFDGDGNVIFGKKYSSGIKYNINICGNEEFLLNTFQRYFPSTNRMYYERKSRQMFVWKISSKERVKAFLEYLYDDAIIYLNRKHEVYMNTRM